MKWISVKDKLPEELTPVMVWDQGFFDYGVGVAEVRAWGDGYGWVYDGEVRTFLEPTHWAPMPDAPSGN